MRIISKYYLVLMGLIFLFSFNMQAQELYTQIGTDRTWEQLLADNAFPIGINSTGGVTGSTIDVNNTLVEIGSYSINEIEHGIKIHTLCNSVIPRSSFPKWSRWYQEDGNTQVFRLFKNETNVRNDRELAARVESFSDVSWLEGAWHEWIGTYTIVKPIGCAILQVKNPINDWAVMLNLNSNGDIILNHRRDQSDKTIARNMIGKSFDIGVRDNGLNYEVYLNGVKVGAGSYARPEGNTAFRWGMYVGANEVKSDAMIFVSGATVDPIPGIRYNIDTLTLSTSTNGFGSIARSPNGVRYAVGAKVNLTAMPADGWTFTGWSGAVTGQSNPVLVTMTGNESVTATFESTQAQAPFGDEPVSIPGIIEAENYDLGAEGISYHDYESGNKFGLYRFDGVDIDARLNGGYVISNIYPGEWLDYAINVVADGYYDVSFIYASRRSGGKLGAEIVGSDTLLFADLWVPLTLSWNDYRRLTKEVVWLSKGEQTLRILFNREGYNLDKIEISSTIGDAIEDVHINPLKLFPVTSYDGIFCLNHHADWSVFSISGHKIKAGSGKLIDLSDQKMGVYIIHYGFVAQQVVLL